MFLTGKVFPCPLMFRSNISLKTWMASFSRLACSRDRTKISKPHQDRDPDNTNVDTSMRNLGLSGMNSLKMTAEVRLGMEQSTTNSLQLWKSSGPR